MNKGTRNAAQIYAIELAREGFEKMKRHFAYILDEDQNPTPADPLYAARWKEETYFTDKWKLGSFKEGDVYISTVFLTFDAGIGDGPPILWETMVFRHPEIVDEEGKTLRSTMEIYR